MPLLLLFPLGYAGAGLYPGFGVGAVETLRRISYCTSFAFLVIAAASFVLKLPAHYSRMSFAIAWGASLVVVPLLRFLLLAVAKRWEWWEEPAVLVGRGPWVQWTIRALENALSLGYRPMWVLSSDLHRYSSDVEGVPVLGGPELAPHLAKSGIRVAFLSNGQGSSDSLLSWFQQHFRHVVVIPEDQDLPVERVRICNLGGILGIELTNNLLRWRNRVVKRTLDLTLGVLFLALSLPLIVLGGLFVKLLSHGPFFFYQLREGLGGHSIAVWKLRTMYQDAEHRLQAFLSANPELRQEWEERFKLNHDPRIIPRVGSFLRRFSIDELPQLWSVVKGEMSLVGPRPFPEYHLGQFPPEFRELRRRVRPGLTGMWQVMVRSDGGIEEQKLYDTYYIRNWSIWLDLWVLFRTVWAVLLGRGAC
jgi:Undecaprenyl-phosphate galactose phosphotransferase WbaP